MPEPEAPAPDDTILIVGPAWVGDMVMAQALFLRLKQRRPNCAIDVLAPGWSLPILARMPEVRASIEMPLTHGQFGLKVRRTLGASLAGRYRQAIVLPGSWKSALVPWFAGIPRRTGFRGEARYGLINDMRKCDERVLRTTAERFVALGLDKSADAAPLVPVPRLTVDITRASQLMAKLGLDGSRHAIGLMPGAEYGPAKQWPPQFYADVAKDLAAAGAQCWIFGSAKEKPLGDHIRRLSGDAALNLCGTTSLVDLVDLVAQCRAVVTNDSGPMHIAAAAGVPVVALYGSSTPDHTPPLTAKKAVHYLRLECSPCFDRTCRFGHYDCLFKIEPHVVRASLRKLAGI
jgi:heptosyltransferase-2